VVAEVDTFDHHGTRRAFDQDRARDAELTALGYRVVRFTGRQLEREPDRCVEVLRAVLAA